MRLFHFKIKGVPEERFRWWRKRTQSSVVGVRPMVWTALAATVLYTIGALGPGRLDQYGNPVGDKHDLVRDNFFEGFTIAVLHLYTGEGFDFSLPTEALKKKGFEIHRWTSPPTAGELSEVLRTSCQLWVISSRTRQLNSDHLAEIEQFFDKGGGLYIYGDNEPFYADANYVAGELLGTTMRGDTLGDQVVGLQTQIGTPGFVRHPIMTGIQVLHEGVTIATIQTHPELDPLLYGSAGNLVVATYDKHGKRAIIDGGFTRLFLRWDAAGSVRYVQNAAAWLAKY